MGNKINMRVAQAAESRNKLLESAKQLFADKGYKGVSVREICRNANLADGLLYHYFPKGKKELYREVVETNIKRIMQEMKNRNSLEKAIHMPLEEALENYYDSFMEIIDNNLDIIRMVFRVNEIKEIVTEEELLKIAGHDNSYIENLLKKKNELGEVRDMDYEIASTTVKDVVVKYAISKIFDVTHSHKHSIDLKERIIQYQVNLWQNK